MKKTKTNSINFIRIYGKLSLIFWILAILFHYFAGEQLYYRDTKGGFKEFGATADTGELVSGRNVRQVFRADLDRIDRVGVMLSDYDKEIEGDITVRLKEEESGRILAEGAIPAADVNVNQYVYIELTDGIRDTRKKLLAVEVMSDNGISGTAATAMYDRDHMPVKDASLYIDGNLTEGMLCIVIDGKDDVWTGNNYWLLSVAMWLFCSAVYLLSAVLYKNHKKEFFFTTALAIKKYRFLIEQLVNRDFKVRYKRSVLGMCWSLLNPLLTMLVQYIVFSRLFRSDIDNYPVYLLSGLVIFNFFNEAVGLSLGAIVGNASLITKVYMPKYVYPVTRVLSSSINLALSMVPLLLVILITGEKVTKAYFLIPYVLICVLLFTMGLGMLLSALMVFFRDIQFLWGIVSMLWMYLTPIFYPETIIAPGMLAIYRMNPLYQYITFLRSITLSGISPEPRAYLTCFLWALVSVVCGSIVFRKLQDQFVINI